jgi:SAM-dependent methyltransferase
MTGEPPRALETRMEAQDGRRFSPSAARNREPILGVIREALPLPARVLEIASGTGEHGDYLTSTLEGLDWTFSDIDGPSLESQRAWRAANGSGRLHGPLVINASAVDWGEAERTGHWDAIFSANMLHIAPFSAAEGLFRGAGRLLNPGGRLILYGPFARKGEMAPSNTAFDASLKARDPAWGVRDLDLELVPLAEAAGLVLAGVTEMPANNLTVMFLRK